MKIDVFKVEELKLTCRAYYIDGEWEVFCT